MKKTKTTNEALVITAVKLTADQQRQIQTILENKINKELRIKCRVDKDVIGGMYIRIGDTVINGTLQNKINKLKEKFQT